MDIKRGYPKALIISVKSVKYDTVPITQFIFNVYQIHQEGDKTHHLLLKSLNDILSSNQNVQMCFL